AAGLLQGQAPGGVEPLIAVAVGGRDDRAPVAQHGPVAGSGRRRRQGRRGRSGGAGGGCETGEYGKNQGPWQARHAALPRVAGPPAPEGAASVRDRTEAFLGPVHTARVKLVRLRSGGQASAFPGGGLRAAARGAALGSRGGLGLAARGRALDGRSGRTGQEARQGGRRLVVGGDLLGARAALAAGTPGALLDRGGLWLRGGFGGGFGPGALATLGLGALGGEALVALLLTAFPAF